MKNNGITLIVLTITVIIMLILGGVIIISTKDIAKTSNATKVYTVMQLVKARAETVIEDKIFDKEDLEEITISNENYLINSEDEIVYIKWGKDEIAYQGIDNSILQDGEYFIIAYNKDEMQVEDIIYTAGCQMEENIVYKMSEIKENM